MKKQYGDYYLGLDIGTDSVGYAVTSTSYNLLKFNGKAMWGSRLFEAAETAADTRLKRSQRRRIERASWRIRLLQSLLAEEISKIDMGFFQRLAESNLHVEDKKEGNRTKFCLFGQEGMSDKDFYEKYQTVYHLRESQLNNKPDAFDIRMVYLSLAHLIKNRGHFLFEGLEAEIGQGGNQRELFKNAYNELVQFLQENFDNFADASFPSAESIKTIMTDSKLTITEKKSRLMALLETKKKPLKAAMEFLSGGKVKFADLFEDEELKELDSLSLKEGNLEEKEAELTEALGERFEAVLCFKAVYDIALLDGLMQGCNSISEAKIRIFEEHGEDLHTLKEFAKKTDKKLFKKIFGVPEGKDNNYSAYIGSCMGGNGKKAVIENKKATQEDFCDFLKKELASYVDFKNVEKLTGDLSGTDKLFSRILNKTAFPKLRAKVNGVIPVQVNEAELKKILENAEHYFPFLAERDDEGLSVSEKIRQIMLFRIPYYVGPLAGTEKSKEAKRCWVKRTREKINPWNFDRVVDKSETAERFIRAMTNKCSYLRTEDVLPKQSLLYTEFEVRNELNNLSVHGERLPVETIQQIFEGLLLKERGKISKKKILDYLKVHKLVPNEITVTDISGVDDSLTCDVKAFKDFYRIFGEEYTQAHKEQIEDIIRWITLFSGEKSMLLTKIRKSYPDIPEEKLREIKKLKYKDWGRLSKTFLDSEKISFYDDSIGVPITFIEAMRREPLNLMQLLSKGHRYGFADKVEEFNGASQKIEKLKYSFIKELAVSPAVKRSIWQTAQIVQEIKQITGHAPKRIFIEMARGGEKEKKRKDSRKTQLQKLYAECKKKAPDIFNQDVADELESKDNDALRSKKLFLYFCQMGKDMYTGKKIDLSELNSTSQSHNVYDCDHIYPRSKTKDDSMDNLCLVHYSVNRDKSDVYPLSPDIQKKMKKFWAMLLDRGLISSKKYERLTRTVPLSDDDLAGFINRQLVETRQSTKAVAEILKLACPESKIVYSKAGNVSDFRKNFDLIKCREVNDMHHAKDAYLNIVVGNAYYTKFTDSPLTIIQKGTVEYSLKPEVFYKWKISCHGNIAWIPEKDGTEGTISTVRRMMHKNNVLVTRMVKENKGEIYNATIYKAGDGKLFPLKAGRDVEKYGGYSSEKTGYFTVIESKNKKGKLIRTIEAVPVYMASRAAKDDELLLDRCRKELLLREPKIVYRKIKVGSCITIDDCAFYLTGTTGKQITGSLANQLVLGSDFEKYVKALLKFDERQKRIKDLEPKESDEIKKEKNLALYNEFVEKLETKQYVSCLEISSSSLKEEREEFCALPVRQQCSRLCELQKLFALLRFNERQKLKKDLQPTKYGEIDKENNLALYDEFVKKLEKKQYVSRPAFSSSSLKEKREFFCALPVNQQCSLLCELLKLFEAKPLTADLTLIGGSKNTGSFKYSKEITSYTSVLLYSYSVTGLFEQEPVDLLHI